MPAAFRRLAGPQAPNKRQILGQISVIALVLQVDPPHRCRQAGCVIFPLKSRTQSAPAGRVCHAEHLAAEKLRSAEAAPVWPWLQAYVRTACQDWQQQAGRLTCEISLRALNMLRAPQPAEASD